MLLTVLIILALALCTVVPVASFYVIHHRFESVLLGTLSGASMFVLMAVFSSAMITQFFMGLQP